MISVAFRLVAATIVKERRWIAMTDTTLQSILRNLNARRKELGMTWDILAKRSGLSRATAIRLLSGDHTGAGFLHIVAVAEALGVEVKFTEVGVEDFVEQQVDRQARRLVGMVQGTMGLEAQGVNEEAASQMVKKTRHELLAGKRKQLWYD
jgi:transcriptional regulator with XRE-family HTH domain